MPLGGQCNSKSIIYEACISPMEHNGGEWIYIGISVGNWKQRLYNHGHSFSNLQLRNQTALSKYFWNLKDWGLTPQIKWKIDRQSSTTNSFNNRCNLCFKEKISIISLKDPRWLVNTHNVLVFKCRRKGKFNISWLRVLLKIKKCDIDLEWILIQKNK